MCAFGPPFLQTLEPLGLKPTALVPCFVCAEAVAVVTAKQGKDIPRFLAVEAKVLEEEVGKG